MEYIHAESEVENNVGIVYALYERALEVNYNECFLWVSYAQFTVIIIKS